jgi:hypothetical protein
VLEGKARFDGPTVPVYIRLARHSDAIYLDLCDERWRVVRIDAAGWKVLSDSPVRFRRIKGMQTLPTPSRGSIYDLQPFVNVANDDDFTLIVAWLLAALNPSGPYPVLVLLGEQGSAKSSLARIVRRLFDPNDCEVRKDVREPRDLAIAANNGRCIAMDNLSSLPAWLSDAMCSLATGGGFATRTLYTDDDETLFSAQRPIVLNGITEIATRPDLLDRSIILNLPTITDERRRPEKQLWAQIEQAWPGILGGLLAGVSCAMRNLEAVQTKPTRWPRMADFAQWVTAAEPALQPSEGHFSRVYSANRADANTIALEDSPVVEGVLRLSESDEWSGSASELLKQLVGSSDEAAKRQQGWPKNASQLSRALRVVAPNLRSVGVNVEFQRDGRRRSVRISKLGKDTVIAVTDATPVYLKPLVVTALEVAATVASPPPSRHYRYLTYSMTLMTLSTPNFSGSPIPRMRQALAFTNLGRNGRSHMLLTTSRGLNHHNSRRACVDRIRKQTRTLVEYA